MQSKNKERKSGKAWNGGRIGEETGKVRKMIKSRKEDGKIKIGHNNKFMALSPLLCRTLEALGGGSEGVENSGA